MTNLSVEGTKVMRKISSTASLHEENVMKTTIASMYENSRFNTSHESILSNLEKFLKSVNTMSHIVMIPSKLMDIEPDEEPETSNSSSNASETSSNSGFEQVNLYDAYRILMDAKENLIWGRDTTLEHDDQLSKKFKYHLDSLNSLVAHFAELADELTVKYQTQTGLE